MPANPAFTIKPLFLSLSEVEHRYLEAHARAADLSVQNYLRQLAGLPVRTAGAPSYSERLEILEQARALCPAIGEDADEYLQPLPEEPRRVGRPRKDDPEPSPAKLAEWEKHRLMNESMRALGYSTDQVPDLPTSWEEERRYKAEGHR